MFIALLALLAPAGVARAAGSAYVANQVESSISQYDIGAGGPLTLKATPSVPSGTQGSDPFGIAVSPDARSLWVINHGTDSIAQFDVGADGGLSPKAPASVADTGANPNAIAVSPDGASVYVANGGGGVSEYDVGAGGKLAPKAAVSVSAGNEPFAIVVTPDGHSVYVTNAATNGPGGVSQYDVGAGGALTPKATATVDAGNSPSGIAVSPDGNSVYVSNRSGGVSQYDVAAGGALRPKATPIVNTGTGAYGIAVSPNGLSVYVTNVGSSGTGGLSQYDVGAGGMLTAKASPTVDTGDGPSSVALTPDGSSAYVTNSFVNGAGGVSQYDVGAGGVLHPKATATVTAGGEPYAIAIASGPPPGLPSASISTPANGATYVLGAPVSASYSCSPGANGGALKPGSGGCSAPVQNGSSIDTSTIGAHAFAVTATDTDGQTTTTTSHYTVTAGPPPQSRPVNLTPPAIVGVAGSPHVYSCSPGTWTGAQGTIDAAGHVFPFTYTWQRLTPDSRFFGGYRIDTAATGQVYRPSAGSAVALAQSWLVRCLVQTSNAAGSTSAVSAPRTLSPAPPLNLANNTTNIRVTGIEVTQSVQEYKCSGCTGTLPSRRQTDTTSPGSANYQGVTLAAGKFTVVRVYADFTQPAAAAVLSAPTARLEVFDSNGSRIATLNPDTAPPALFQPDCAGACVSLNDRAQASLSFNFLLPWDETLHRALSFRATVSPRVGLSAPVQCATCKANTFTLVGVPFVPTATVAIRPIPLTEGGVQTPQTVNQVFEDAQTVLPVNVQIFPYDAPLAIDGLNTAQASAAVDQRASDDHIANTQYPIGVFIDGAPGGGCAKTTPPSCLTGLTDGSRILYGGHRPISIVRDDRPLTSAMHEIGHGLGLVHADTGSPAATPNGPDNTGPHPDGTPDCGGNSKGQKGETWPAQPPLDNEGRLDGVGLDRRNWDIFQTGSLPRTLVEGYPAAGIKYYDFMSYCANTNEAAKSGNRPDAWISIRNWTRLIGFHPPSQALPAAAGPRALSGPLLRVIATVDATGRTSIFSVDPQRQAASAPTTGSPYRFELRDAAGHTLTSVTAGTTTLHEDGQRPGLLLEATLPFPPSTAALVVNAAGVELAHRERSAHAPIAKLISPRPGSHPSGGTSSLVRWTARDPDGDRLTTTVDYSADGGRDWKVVAGPLTGHSVRVPKRALSASSNARLRIRVSDGFDVATATSGRLRSAGALPLVQIISLGQGGRVGENTMLLLQGAAFDDAGRPLSGRHLKWYAGSRLLGRGDLLTVFGLSPQVKAIRLVATDTRGRSSGAQLRIKVVPIPPAFLVARAPEHVAPTARRVRIVVASTVPAVLTIAGARHRVDRNRRAITIAIRRGHGTLRLKYSLRSTSGGVTRGVYVAAR